MNFLIRNTEYPIQAHKISARKQSETVVKPILRRSVSQCQVISNTLHYKRKKKTVSSKKRLFSTSTR